MRYLPLVTPFLLCLSLASVSHAQTITDAAPLQHTLGGTIEMTVTLTGAATGSSPFTLRHGVRTMTGSYSWLTTNVYNVTFYTNEFDVPGSYTLYYNNSSYGTQVVLNPTAPYPTTMSFLSTMKWTTGATSGSASPVRDMVIDASGNIYVCGEYATQVNIPPLTRTGESDGEGYIAKLAPDGTALWISTLTGGYNDIINGIELYQDSILFVTGQVQFNTGEPVKFNDDTLQAPWRVGTGEGVVMRLNDAGALQWYALQAGYGVQSAQAALVIGDDHVLVTGAVGAFSTYQATFYSAGTADSTVLELGDNEGYGFYVADYGTNGALHWVRHEEYTTYTSGEGMDLRRLQDDVLAIATSSRDIVYDSTSCTTSCCNQKVFMMRLDTAGERKWCYWYGNFSQAPWVDVDAAGNTYLMPSHHDLFWNTRGVLKLDANGVEAWSAELQNASWSYEDFHDCAQLLPDGSVMVAYEERLLDYYCNSGHVVLKKVSPDGVTQATLWPTLPTYCGAGRPLCMAWDPVSQTTVVVGRLEHSATFGADALAPQNNIMTVFMTRIDDDVAMSAPSQVGLPGMSVIVDRMNSSATITARGSSSIIVYDALGRAITSAPVVNGTATVRLDGWAPGFYVAADPKQRNTARFCVAP